ncbi:sigma-70 family RNA polymerase sigma factor [Promicromonospora citrea]|uniref:DNA-directed RNA polymerase sigma-70 factor n=1 Tax=Promicromonospora citrea TaxID=43677 RepID=A0A8H9GCW4_9MICO|nr:sigma-70 family RNA polymerase sigma factor [Promicromonospora citrea]NNH52896.1 sigma-70 family RNA polymerase sigma factor [Promicromonospora citrea]GGM08854.1 DNA-directed RNA polymerase sigma-70 factor [Promicromonospora citrea]
MSARWDDELTELVRTRGRALVGYGYALTGDVRRAEDLVQDALVRVFRRFRRPEAAGTRGRTEIPLDEAKVQAGIEAYVRRTMLNLFLDETRRTALWHKARPTVASATEVRAPASDITARADVTAALRDLSPRQRACVVLRYYDDLTVPQIATTLGVAQGTIKRHLSDAIQALRGVLVLEGER